MQNMPDSTTASSHGEGTPATPAGPQNSLVIGEARQEAFWRGQRLDLSPTECAVLAYLHRHVGRAVSHDALLQGVWGTPLDQGGSLAQVRNTVTRLRQKLAAAGVHSCQIASIRGIGYRLELAPARRPRQALRPLFSLSGKRIALLAGLVGLIALLLAGWLAWQQLRTDPHALVWYRGHQVPASVLRIVNLGRHCCLAPDGGFYCFDSEEELAAATGMLLPGIDPEAVKELRESGAVPDLRRNK